MKRFQLASIGLVLAMASGIAHASCTSDSWEGARAFLPNPQDTCQQTGDDTAGNFPDLSGFMPPKKKDNPPHRKPPGKIPPDENLAPADAARFLDQATFGITQEDLDHLARLGSVDAWLDEQFALPLERQLSEVRKLDRRMCYQPEEGYTDSYNDFARRQVWWKHVVEGRDQLRQRVAFALSQIFVVSDRGMLGDFQYGMTDYWDMLMEHAFGNYRDLLEAVTLHPMMGEWLSSIRNRKAVPEENIHPDENYAREVLQLFSIGLVQLNPDGTPKLDDQGKPIPTYGQKEIREFARVFTGLIYDGVGEEWWRTPWDGAITTAPMVPYEPFHDTGAKTLLNGKKIPAGGTTLEDIEAALDIIFEHPNVGPFISRLLIQRLVTSNPSPAYIERVAGAFDDNGDGVRGDLEAVVRAILTDPEARGTPAPDSSMGKLREPILRQSHLWRAFGITSQRRRGTPWEQESCGRPAYELYWIWWMTDMEEYMGEDILGAPSVFNFFLPDFQPSGALSEAGLYGPEFQIATESRLTATANLLDWTIQGQGWGDGDEWSVLDLSDEAEWGRDIDALLDRLDLLLLAGRLDAGDRALLKAHLQEVQDGEESTLQRVVEDAILLLTNSPAYLIQQ